MACRSTTASTRRRIILSRPTRDSRATSVFWAIGCPIGKRAWNNSFLNAAEQLPDRQFLLGGIGWGGKPLPPNVRYFDHVYTPRSQRV